MTKDDKTPLKPYQSARNLPSYQKMSKELKGLKTASLLVARRERPKIRQIERDLQALAENVDRFYARLGERNWVYDDKLPTEFIGEVLDAGSGAAAEARLISAYGVEGFLEGRVADLRYREEWSARDGQLARALRHYRANEFDSCALHLIAVMDGFVNDFRSGERRGLHARDADEMVAWDSVVGHHLGLTHALRTFRKVIKKRMDEEVFELYRHGIVHGSVVRFDNVVVATKAWNMLFAVEDWARATEAAEQPEEPEPTLGELAKDIWRYATETEYRERFAAITYEASDAGFWELGVVKKATAFLESWRNGRWGLVVDAISPKILRVWNSNGQGVERVKGIYELHPLDYFEISSVEFSQAHVAVLRGDASIGGESGRMEIRWLHMNPHGGLALPGDKGAVWYLAVFAPRTFINKRDCAGQPPGHALVCQGSRGSRRRIETSRYLRQ